ncbi:hypothetical protein JCM10908_006305 [Rhodotorula pacifica]|uniref:uncharacterized protein n=1 Tax=Rhodotorula pacifica TaxID=1495444 RepID=UPI00316B49A1
MTSHPSWSFTAPPSSSGSSAPSQQQHFTSSFGAFGLPQPRASPSNLSLQLESRGVGTPAPFGAATTTSSSAAGGGAAGAPNSGLAVPALWGSAPVASNSTAIQASGGAAIHARRGSMLAADAMNWEDDAETLSNWPTTETPSGAHAPLATGGGRDDETTMMSLSPSGPPSALSQQLAAAGPSSSTTAMFPRQTRSRSGSASNPMLLTPSVPSALPPSLLPFPTVPPSPVTIARALQVGQKTPPPFLARRLFKEGVAAGGDSMQEESTSASGRSSRSGSSSDTAANAAHHHQHHHHHAPRPRVTRAVTMSSALVGDEDEEIEELSAVLSRSASAGPEDPFERVVRRPVSRKPNLLPKTKSHLRVLTELRTESSGDQAEIASEATLFRLSRSGAKTVPGMRSSCPNTSAFDAPRGAHSHAMSAAGGGHGSSASGSRSAPGGGNGGSLGGAASGPRPPPNRFPEQIEEDDMLSSHRLGGSSSSSNDGEIDEVAEAGSDWGGMSVGGYGTEDEEERRSNIVWNGIRSGPGGSAVTVATPTSSTRSPGGATGSGMRGMMDTDIPFAAPQTPSSSVGTRRGKRKLNDDRFEPYAHHAFKRRAVSPAASLSLSPGFGSSGGGNGGGAHSTTSTSSSSRPTPPPLGNSSLSTSTLPAQSQPVAIPSPPSEISHHQFFSTLSAGARSVANSPSATASSLSSSTGGGLGRGFMSFALSDRHRPISVVEEGERLRAAPAEGMGKMSLGGQASVEDGEEEL